MAINQNIRNYKEKECMSTIYFSNGNKLLPSTNEYVVRIFNIPAISIRDENGNIDKKHPNICIEAPEICKEICYAYKRQSGREVIVYGSRKNNYDATQSVDFANEMIKKIKGTIKYYKNKKVKIIYRIHESGDFYHIDYLDKWVEIANNFKENKNVIFMAYTKNIELLDTYLIKNEMKLTDINIRFKYSIMKAKKCGDKTLKNTENQKCKLAIAEKLRSEGLTYFTIYDKDEDISSKFKAMNICKLDEEGHDCSICKMKCYLNSYDIVGKAR